MNLLWKSILFVSKKKFEMEFKILNSEKSILY